MAKEIKVRLILQDIQTNSGSKSPPRRQKHLQHTAESFYIKNTIEYLPNAKAKSANSLCSRNFQNEKLRLDFGEI